MHRAAIVAALALACGRPGETSEHVPETMPTKTGHEEHEGHHADKGHHGDHPEPRADHRGLEHHKHHKFDDAAKWSQQFDSPDRAAWQKPDEVVAALGLTPAMRVADLGAGTGYFTVRLARAVPQGQVVAEDIEPDMVRHIGERAKTEGLTNVQAVQGEPGDPKLPAGLDVAIMVDTYHHVEDPAGFFARVRDALKPGGLLVIVDFKKDAPDDAPGPPAAMRVDDQTLAATLTGLGLSHERTDRALLPYQYLVFMRRPK
jgi:SAM-dependent methyltransferase